MQSESNEDLLVEAKHLYEKMLENITNKSITSLMENMSSVSTFAQQELCGQQAFHPNFDAIKNDSNDTTNT
jgi:hypothetical protein